MGWLPNVGDDKDAKEQVFHAKKRQTLPRQAPLDMVPSTQLDANQFSLASRQCARFSRPKLCFRGVWGRIWPGYWATAIVGILPEPFRNHQLCETNFICRGRHLPRTKREEMTMGFFDPKGTRRRIFNAFPPQAVDRSDRRGGGIPLSAPGSTWQFGP